VKLTIAVCRRYCSDNAMEGAKLAEDWDGVT
jgi:hypothetical protein